MSTEAGELHGTATVQVGERSVELSLDVGERVRRRRRRFSVPELAAPTPATITATLGKTHLRRETVLHPARKWTIHMPPHSHLDVGYTDAEAKVCELHNRNVDTAVEIVGARPFSVDGSFIVDNYLRTRRGDRRRAALDAMSSGQIG